MLSFGDFESSLQEGFAVAFANDVGSGNGGSLSCTSVDTNIAQGNAILYEKALGVRVENAWLGHRETMDA